MDKGRINLDCINKGLMFKFLVFKFKPLLLKTKCCGSIFSNRLELQVEQDRNLDLAHNWHWVSNMGQLGKNIFHRVSTGQVPVRVPQEVPHWASYSEPVSRGIKLWCLSPWHLEVSHLDEENEHTTSPGPQGTQRCLFMFKGFFLDHLPPFTQTHLMRVDIKDPCKLATKTDEIWQSASARSVNAVSTASPPPAQDDAILNTLHQCPLPGPAPPTAPHPTPHTACPPAPPRPHISAGIMKTTETKLINAMLLVPRFQETNWLAGKSCSYCQRL